MSQYKDGTVSVTNGSSTVTGTSTLWLANATVGNSFKIQGENAIYNITSVDANTTIHISPNYAGATGSGESYIISKDFTPILGLYEPSGGDVDWPYLLTQTLRNIDTQITTKSPTGGPGSGQAFATGPLTVAGPVSTIADFILGTSGAASSGAIGFAYNSAVGGNIIFGGTSSGIPGVMTISTPGQVERMRLNNNGNLLIGTTVDDGNKLQVNGSVKAAMFETNPAAIDGSLLSCSINGVYKWSVAPGAGTGADTNFNWWNYVTNTVNFSIQQVTGNILVNTITDDGSGAKLQVAGDVTVAGNLLAGATGGSYHILQKSNANSYAAAVTNGALTSPAGMLMSYTGVSNGSGGNFLVCQDSNSLRFAVSGNGNASNANNSYGAISDSKLKENVSTARGYLDDLCKTRIVKYSLIADHEDHATHLGVIAQELEQIFPGMIEETKDTAERSSGKYEQMEITPAVMDGDLIVTPAVMDDDPDKPIMERYETGEVTKGVKYSVFVPMLITAVQELKAKNDTLEARVSNLEFKLIGIISKLNIPD